MTITHVKSDIQREVPVGADLATGFELETSIPDTYRDWRSYRDWLSGPECASMGDAQFNRHMEAMSAIERRICMAQPRSSSDLGMQIEVYTSGGDDDEAVAEIHALIGRAAA